jgi:prephenate dehydrogenase
VSISSPHSVVQQASQLRTVLVVGTGLIGTSVALSLAQHSIRVHLADSNASALQLAVDLGAGTAAAPQGDPDLVLIAVPPAALIGVLVGLQRQYLRSIFSDVSSIKARPQAEMYRRGIDASRFIGGHPMAGRERSGAAAARADLFDGRPWVLTPGVDTSPRSLALATELARLSGAVPIVMTPERHDVAVALVSHVPQLVASLMAARLHGAPDDLVALSGQGVRDVTRIAASDPELWTQILSSNADAIGVVLDVLAVDLDHVRGALAKLSRRQHLAAEPSVSDEAIGTVRDLLERGNAGRARIPGKHGTAPAAYATVPVVIADRPGELARLLVAAGDAGVNVEDVTIEHSPGHPVGVIELSVRPESALRLACRLRTNGWVVHA